MTPEPDLLFLCGADMDPFAVLAAHPGARFVARARVTEPPPDRLPDWWPDAAGAGGVWGILVRLAGPAAAAEAPVAAETDDGRRVAARFATGAADLEDAAAVLAAARYWELRPAYVRSVAFAALDSEQAP